jgi:hypothetical protein
MRALMLALVVLLGLPPAAAAEPQRLIVPTLLGEYHLLFDDRRVTEAQLRALVVLSPHLAGWTSLAVAPRLERCVVGDSAYLDCGNRSVRSHTFLWNARVNLERGRDALTHVRGLRVPAELEPVSTWLQRSLAFSLWLEETKLEFFRTADVGVLRRRYEDLDPGRECAAVLGKVARATSADAQFDMVVLPWHNCANAQFRRRLGDYPMAAWLRFLSAWRITERLVEMLPKEVERR